MSSIPPPEGSLTTWALGILVGTVTFLASIIGKLWQDEKKTNKERIDLIEQKLAQADIKLAASQAHYEQKLQESDEKHEKCEEGRHQLHVECTTLKIQLDMLSRKVDNANKQ